MRRCPICDQSVRFREFRGRAHAKCPKCGSLERHRLDWMYFTRRARIQAKPGEVLHVAPEPCLRTRFKSIPGIRYTSGDIRGRKAGATHRVNLHHIPFAGGRFDWVYCSHVLEHVQDDLVAMREIRRVLNPIGGIAVLQVPIVEGRMTYRNVAATTPSLRRRYHGQENHERQYGSLDYHLILSAAGFHVETVWSDSFLSKGEHNEFGIHRVRRIDVCSVNNTLGGSGHDRAAT